jgi:hypothetical protein
VDGLACFSACGHSASNLGTSCQMAMAASRAAFNRWSGSFLRACNRLARIDVKFGKSKASTSTVASPNGSHDAKLTYKAGFLGRDFSMVEITKKGCCQHFRAYTYAGPSDLDSTTVIWVDDSHLRIKYTLDPDRNQHCESHVTDVTVICEPSTAGKN